MSSSQNGGGGRFPSFDPNDPTFRVHAEALRSQQEEAETSEDRPDIDDHLYELLLKNVSKNQPLSEEELQVN
jgi:hypothetical protein